jgi:hypothetical protein
MARGQRNRGGALAAPPMQAAQIDTGAPSKPAQCAALDSRIRYLDQLARSGGTAQYMDGIANERKQSRDVQFQIRC